MNDITVSLEWAKKLEECDWRGSSYWLWAFHCYDLPAKSEYQKPFLCSRDTEDHNHQWEMCRAPTWSDIWFSLPEELRSQQQETFEITLDSEFLDEWNPAIHGIEYITKFQSHRTDTPLFVPKESTMHDDMAATYCYLVEHNLLPIK